MSRARLVATILVSSGLAASAGCQRTELEAPVCRAEGSGCSCVVGASSDASTPCTSAAAADALCCASAGWPGSGACSCLPVTCIDQPDECRCARGLGGPLSLCGGALCCAKPGGDCYCRTATPGIPPRCDRNEQAGAFCKPSVTRCPPGERQVNSCT